MMSEYQRIRDEFHRLQRAGQVEEIRVPIVEFVAAGQALSTATMPPGMCGLSIFRRANGTRICEEAVFGGAADGCARYFDERERPVGEDYYTQGGVMETRVYA
jgi:hypothetical protein